MKKFASLLLAALLALSFLTALAEYVPYTYPSAACSFEFPEGGFVLNGGNVTMIDRSVYGGMRLSRLGLDESSIKAQQIEWLCDGELTCALRIERPEGCDAQATMERHMEEMLAYYKQYYADWRVDAEKLHSLGVLAMGENLWCGLTVDFRGVQMSHYFTVDDANGPYMLTFRNGSPELIERVLTTFAPAAAFVPKYASVTALSGRCTFEFPENHRVLSADVYLEAVNSEEIAAELNRIGISLSDVKELGMELVYDANLWTYLTITPMETRGSRLQLFLNKKRYDDLYTAYFASMGVDEADMRSLGIITVGGNAWYGFETVRGSMPTRCYRVVDGEGNECQLVFMSLNQAVIDHVLETFTFVQ